MQGCDGHVGPGLWEFLLRIWERTAFPLGKKEAQKDTRRGKWKDFAGEAQVSVPDALPTWVWERRHASVGHMPAQGVAILSGKLGSWSRVLLPLCVPTDAKSLSVSTNRYTFPSSWTVGTHVV